VEEFFVEAKTDVISKLSKMTERKQRAMQHLESIIFWGAAELVGCEAEVGGCPPV
jgi:hypothetical protein